MNHCITLLHALTTQPFSTSGQRLIRELVANNLNSGPMTLRRDSMLLLCTLTKDNAEATRLLYKKLYERITEAMEFCTSAASLVSARHLSSGCIMYFFSLQSVRLHASIKALMSILLTLQGCDSNKLLYVVACRINCAKYRCASAFLMLINRHVSKL